MRRHVIFAAALLLAAGPVLATDAPADATTYGDFSVMILKAMSDSPDEAVSPKTALDELKQRGVAPKEWQLDGAVTHGDLALVSSRLGVDYEPANDGQLLTAAFAEEYLRRSADELSVDPVNVIGSDNVLAEGDNTGISPGDF